MAFIPLKRFLRILEGWKRNCGVFIPSDVLLSSPPCLPPPRYNFISSLSSSSSSSSCNPALLGPEEALPEAPPHLPDLRGAPAPAAAVGGSSQGQVFPVVEHCMRHWLDFTERPCNGRSGSVFLRYLFSVFLVIKIQKKSIASLKGATDRTKCVLSLSSLSLFLFSKALK